MFSESSYTPTCIERQRHVATTTKYPQKAFEILGIPDSSVLPEEVWGIDWQGRNQVTKYLPEERTSQRFLVCVSSARSIEKSGEDFEMMGARNCKPIPEKQNLLNFTDLQTVQDIKEPRGFCRTSNGKIITLPNQDKTAEDVARYNFLAASDKHIFVVDNKGGIVQCYCIVSSKHLGQLASTKTSNDLRGVTVIKLLKDKTRDVVIIADKGNQSLIAIEINEICEVKFETSFGVLKEPCGLCSNGNDKIFATDWENKTINIFHVKVDDDNKCQYHEIGKFRNPKLSFPYCLALSQTKIIVGQPIKSSIIVFSEKGDLLKEIRCEEILDGESPRGIATDQVGNIFVANGKRNDVLIFNPNGNFQSSSNGPDFLQLSCPRSIAISPNDQIVVLANLENQFNEEVVVIF